MITAMSLPFLAKKPLDIPPIVSAGMDPDKAAKIILKGIKSKLKRNLRKAIF